MRVKIQRPQLDEPYRSIPLGGDRFALVDADDYELLKKYNWYAKKSNCKWYACRAFKRNGQVIILRMHRIIMHCPPQKTVHHKNRSSLDNRKKNLEVMDRAQHTELHRFEG